MTLIVKYIANVSTATGEILTVHTVPSGPLPEEGIIEGSDPEQELFHLRSDEWEGHNLLQIVNQFYRKNNTWINRGNKPTENHEWNFSTEAWELNSEKLWINIRHERRSRLNQTDWTVLPDAPLTAAKKTEWAVYRQELRDIPLSNSNVTSISEVTWPTPPA